MIQFWRKGNGRRQVWSKCDWDPHHTMQHFVKHYQVQVFSLLFNNRVATLSDQACQTYCCYSSKSIQSLITNRQHCIKIFQSVASDIAGAETILFLHSLLLASQQTYSRWREYSEVEACVLKNSLIEQYLQKWSKNYV